MPNSHQPSLPIQTVSVTRQVEIGIQATSSASDLEAPLWAINWFNRRSSKLYTLYNYLAAPVVMSVGAGLHFKGVRQEMLSGSESHQRDALLIVGYPRAGDFLRMVGNRYFQAISLFRELGVKGFQFGFTESQAASTTIQPGVPGRYRGVERYLVLLFDASKSKTKQFLANIETLAHDNDVRLHFAGHTTARLGAVRNGKPFNPIAFFASGVAVFGAADAGALRSLANHADLQSFLDDCRDHTLSIFRRDY